jgi:Flp pilus assembly protein TadD
MRDYYRILGIRSDATREEIKDAWNFSVKAFHPDKFASSSPRQQTTAQERTKVINEAYEVLSDPVRRSNYDWKYARERSTPAAAPPPRPPPPTAQRPADTASGRKRTRPTTPRKPAFNFRRTVEFLKNCVRRFKTSIANLIRKLSKGVIGTTTFFAALMAKMSKVSAEVFHWFYGKRKLLAGGVILLLVGVGLGTSLSSSQHPLLAKIHRLFTAVASCSSTTFARLRRSPAKGTIPSSAATTPTALTEATSPPYPSSLIDRLVREAVELRDRGDTTHAIYRLQQALEIEQNNATALTEIAKTYDLMRLYDYANEVWRQLQQMGPSAGAAYELANQRLKVGVPAPPTVEPGGAPAEADVPARKDVGGNAEGPIMGISDVKTKETSDPKAETNLALEIGIKKQPGAVIDHNKVKILVFLYDIVNDKDIKLTDADVSNEWLTPKRDWSDTNPEVLLVRYLRAKTGGALSESSLLEAAAKVRPGQKNRGSKGSADIGQRKYLGYIVRVYYGDDLQAVQAEPARLLQQFPPSKNSTAADSRSKFEQSQQAFRQRDFATALKLVEETEKADPHQPATLNLRGEILMQQGQFDDAEAAFKKAAKWIRNFAMRNTTSRKFHSKRKSTQKRATASRRCINACPVATKTRQPS